MCAQCLVALRLRLSPLSVLLLVTMMCACQLFVCEASQLLATSLQVMSSQLSKGWQHVPCPVFMVVHGSMQLLSGYRMHIAWRRLVSERTCTR